MNTYLVLLRGVNVGGKNILPMAVLREYLENQGYSDVSTYIASGNIICKTYRTANEVKDHLEINLPVIFKLDDQSIKVLILTRGQLQRIIDHKPRGFGQQPEIYHSDIIFLMGIDSKQALTVFDPREGVDTVWPGDGVIYSQRLSALRTKSRLSKIVGTPFYKSMTIRNWNTTTELLELLKKVDNTTPGEEQ